MTASVDLSHGRWSARLDPLGGALAALRHGDRDLVVERSPDALDFCGATLTPWPNRIAHGRYEWDGTVHTTPVTEPARDAALHGLATDVEWTIEQRTDTAATLAVEVGGTDGYPWRVRTSVSYALGDDGLAVTTTSQNLSDATAPYGTGSHPYLLPLTTADDAVVRLGAATRLEVTPDTLEPVRLADVDGHAHDLREPGRLGDLELDHGFTDLDRDPDGVHRTRLDDVELWQDEAYAWVHVFTSPDRRSMAVEPVTAGPGAFNTGRSVIALEPGRAHSARWGLALR